MACRLTLPVTSLSYTNLHLFRSWAVRLAFSKVRPVHWVMLSLHCSLGLPLPRLPSTMPSSRSLCRESCRMTCPKNDSFLFFTVSNSDLLVPAIRITSSFVMRLVQLIRSMRLRVHISNASRRCCDILLMVHVSTPYSNVDQTYRSI